MQVIKFVLQNYYRLEFCYLVVVLHLSHLSSRRVIDQALGWD
jgi:hypothetical protein